MPDLRGFGYRMTTRGQSSFIITKCTESVVFKILVIRGKYNNRKNNESIGIEHVHILKG